MEKIDITMTAVKRPGILQGTLKTFCERLFTERDRYRLIINIDPVGEKVKPKEVLRVCKMFFKKEQIVYRVPKKASFPKAVIWIWSQVEAPWVFHVEDDINLLREVDINHMIEILKNHKKLACLRMPRMKIPKKKTIRVFGSPYFFNEEGFYVAKDQKRQFGLNPVLIRSEFINAAVPRMVETINPEKQFRYGNKKMRPLIMKWKYALYARPGDKRLIDGRKGQRWKNNINLQKPRGETFVSWVRG